MDNEQKREIAKQAMSDKLLSVGIQQYQEWLLDIFFEMPEEAVNAKLLEYAQMKKQALEGMVAEVTNESTQQVADLNQGISDMQDLIDQLGDS